MKGVVGLAFDGLRRKPGRNLLTLLGVAIGVLALTLIVSLGQGLAGLVEGTIAGEEDLRQIGLSPGFGFRIGGDAEASIDDAIPEARRERLRRAARARSRPTTSLGRRAQVLDAAALAGIATRPHVREARPVVLERYRLVAGDHEEAASATLGVDVARGRLRDRVVAGRYLEGADADEALVHEYLAYRWGYEDEASLDRLVGTEIVLEPIESENAASIFAPAFALQLLDQADLDVLTEEEFELLPGIAEKLLLSWWRGGGSARTDAATGRALRVVGVVRGLEPEDPFRALEDGGALQADVFLPQETAEAMFLAAPVNRELGYQRAIVTVDDASHAGAVEAALRDEGWTAYSVAGLLERFDAFLAAVTVVVSFLTGIALFVAALGIVNTMVTSVLERTREIGLWKAVGATNGQVRAVFLLEAAAIGILGGLLGLLLARLAMLPLEGVAARLIQERATLPWRGDVFRVPVWLPPTAVLLAAAVSMLAALQPAARAARIDPVRALHHE